MYRIKRVKKNKVSEPLDGTKIITSEPVQKKTILSRISPTLRPFVFIIGFATIGAILLQTNFAATPYGLLLTGADEIVLRYETPMAHYQVENDFAPDMPPAMLLYGNGLMLCSSHMADHENPNMSPLQSMKQRSLTNDEVEALVTKVRSLGFDTLQTRVKTGVLPPYGAMPSLGLTTSSGERKVTLNSGENSAEFTAITDYLDTQCAEAKTDFNPDEVVLETLKLPELADSSVAPLPDIPLNDDQNGSTYHASKVTGNDAKKLKSVVSKENKVYKTSNGRKIRVKVTPKIPEYKVPSPVVASTGSAVAHADSLRKVRFIYEYASDQAQPGDASSIINDLGQTLPVYYQSQLGNKTFSVGGISIVQSTHPVSYFHTCPNGYNCSPNGTFNSALADYYNLLNDNNNKLSNYNTIVVYGWKDAEPCQGWGGPVRSVDDVLFSDYGFASFSGPACWPDALHHLAGHEGGHGFGLVHVDDGSLMSTINQFPGYNGNINANQKSLLYNSSPWFNLIASVSTNPVSSGTTFVSTDPARIYDSRGGGTTIDGQNIGGGVLAAGSTTAIQVGGRAGVPSNALAAALNVTIVNPSANGYAVAFPCDAPKPITSSINYNAGANISNVVIAKLDGSGRVCIYVNNNTDLVVDINGAFPSASTKSYTNIYPARLMDSRPGSPTSDGQYSGTGRLGAGSTAQIQIAGRVGIPGDASAVSLNVTAINPSANGYITAYPCGISRPLTSNINYSAGANVSNAVITKIGSGGTICIYVNNDTDLAVDVNGAFNSVTSYKSVAPARLLETRSGYSTIDGQFNGINRVGAGSTTQLDVAGRAGVPTDSLAAALNVTAINPDANGYLTVYPCGTSRPSTSNVNYNAGTAITNVVLSKLGSGKVCIYANNNTDMVVDINGAFTVTDTQQYAAGSVVPDPISPIATGTLPDPICPTGYTGTYPNCVAPTCPSGTTGTYPNCVAITCPSGYTGTYPNCVAPVCPSGTTGTYPNCVTITCPNGYTGTYPNCVIASRCTGVTLYGDPAYTGSTQVLNIGSYDTSQLTIGNDVISSAKVPSGCQLTLFLNSAFTGATQVLKKDWAGSSTDPWNNLASSVKIEESPLITSATSIICPSNGVTVYKDANFTGTYKILSSGSYTGRKLPVGNDVISSVKVAPGCKVTLYQNSTYAGATKVLTGDWTAVAGDPWNDITSSFVVSDRATAVAGTTEMLQNPGFELGNVGSWRATLPSGGTTTWGVKNVAGQAQSGSYYMEASSTPGGASIYQWVPQSQNLVPGDTYRYTAWYRSPSCAPVSLYHTLWSQASNTNSYVLTSVDCTWRQLSTTFSIKAVGDTTLTPTVSINTGSTILDIDSTSLVKITYAE